ncbi:hypothetical protein ACJU26_10040 [Acidithiobacillus sp. M4-SHS-6]|uniref:hypothetical protein n=1 Tax=Acidithiobacillus sp. M4-SHS-6 TaxID=3383024 RepID=UPI0039BEA349
MTTSSIANKIANEIISAIEGAHHEYVKWSGGYWLWRAPEYFTTVRIADKLIKLKEISYIELEHGVRDALEIAGANGPGRRPKLLRVNGRFDILLYGEKNDAGDYLPMTAVEVKVRPWDHQKSDEDVCRLIELIKLRNRNSIQFSVFAFHVSYDNGRRDKAGTRIKNFFKRIEGKTEETLTNSKYKNISKKIISGDIHVESTSAWCAGTMILQTGC